jgi:hypothetical protein
MALASTSGGADVGTTVIMVVITETTMAVVITGTVVVITGTVVVITEVPRAHMRGACA